MKVAVALQNILLLLIGHIGKKSAPYRGHLPPSSYWKNSPDPAELGTTMHSQTLELSSGHPSFFLQDAE